MSENSDTPAETGGTQEQSDFVRQNLNASAVDQTPETRIQMAQTTSLPFKFGQIDTIEVCKSLTTSILSDNPNARLTTMVNGAKRSKLDDGNCLSIDGEIVRLNQAIGELESKLCKKINNLETRINELVSKQVIIEAKLVEEDRRKTNLSSINSRVEGLQHALDKCEFPPLSQNVLPTTSWSKRLFARELETGGSAIQRKPQLDMLNYVASDFEDRERKKHCIIAFGVPESKATTNREAKSHDQNTVRGIFAALGLDPNSCIGLHRFNKKSGEETKISPLRIILAHDIDRDDILKEARKLRNTKFDTIYLHPDMTAAELHQHKQKRLLLKLENDKLKASGEYLSHRIIISGNGLKKIELRHDQQGTGQLNTVTSSSITSQTNANTDSSNPQLNPISSASCKNTDPTNNGIMSDKRALISINTGLKSSNILPSDDKLLEVFNKPEVTKVPVAADQISTNTIKPRCRSNSRATRNSGSTATSKSSTLHSTDDEHMKKVASQPGQDEPKKRGPKKKAPSDDPSNTSLGTRSLSNKPKNKEGVAALDSFTNNTFSVLASHPGNNTAEEAMAH